MDSSYVPTMWAQVIHVERMPPAQSTVRETVVTDGVSAAQPILEA